MVSKHKIEMVLTWYQRGYDVQLIAHHLGLDPRADAGHPTPSRPSRHAAGTAGRQTRTARVQRQSTVGRG